MKSGLCFLSTTWPEKMIIVTNLDAHPPKARRPHPPRARFEAKSTSPGASRDRPIESRRLGKYSP